MFEEQPNSTIKLLRFCSNPHFENFIVFVGKKSMESGKKIQSSAMGLINKLYLNNNSEIC